VGFSFGWWINQKGQKENKCFGSPPTQLINTSHMMQKEKKKNTLGKTKIPTTTHYFVVGQSKRLIAKANF